MYFDTDRVLTIQNMFLLVHTC